VRKVALLIILLFPFVVFGQPSTTIYVAKKIITLDQGQPTATAVAVKEGRIYSVGSLSEMQQWMPADSYQINRDFANDTLVPGFIEAHSHFSQIAMFFSHTYLGYFDYPGFNNEKMPGSKTKELALKRLQEAGAKLTDPNQPLIAWGYDPIYLGGQEITADELDKISSSRPVFVLNASGHIAYVNNFLLNKAGYNSKTTLTGVVKDKNDKPTGTLKELAAILPVLALISAQAAPPEQLEKNFQQTADLARRAGLTTLTDLY